MKALELPSQSSYLCSVLISLIPKAAVIIFSIVIAAFRTELFSAAASTTGLTTPQPSFDNSRELPLRVCFYEDRDDDIYGDRICNNAMAASITSILVAIVLLLIDLQVPCVSSAFTRMAHILSVFWSVLLAGHWLITGAFLSNLYDRFCDSLEDNTSTTEECGDIQEKFILLPCMAFFCMVAWIFQGVLSFILWITGK